MKTIGVLFLAFLVFTSSRCEKERKDCHRDIKITNESSSTIVYALKFHYNDRCILQGTEVAPNKTFTESSRICWEERLSDNQTQEIYIVDPNNFNVPDKYYSCDSVEHKNTILKQFRLTLEDLKNRDFVIVYQ